MALLFLCQASPAQYLEYEVSTDVQTGLVSRTLVHDVGQGRIVLLMSIGSDARCRPAEASFAVAFTGDDAPRTEEITGEAVDDDEGRKTWTMRLIDYDDAQSRYHGAIPFDGLRELNMPGAEYSAAGLPLPDLQLALDAFIGELVGLPTCP